MADIKRALDLEGVLVTNAISQFSSRFQGVCDNNLMYLYSAKFTLIGQSRSALIGHSVKSI